MYAQHWLSFILSKLRIAFRTNSRHEASQLTGASLAIRSKDLHPGEGRAGEIGGQKISLGEVSDPGQTVPTPPTPGRGHPGGGSEKESPSFNRTSFFKTSKPPLFANRV